MANYNYYEVDRRRVEIGNLLQLSGCTKSSILNYKGDIAYDWKLDTNELKDVVQELKSIDPDKELVAGYTVNELIDIFELWIEQSENGIANIKWY